MGRYKKISKLLSIFIFSAAFFCISCKQTLPEIKYAVTTVIFDYSEKEDYPEARLGVFVESASDSRRFESITLNSTASGYTWQTSDIVKFSLDRNQRYFAGYTNFVVPDNEKVPSGEYVITYENADGEKTTVNSNLNYDSTYYSVKREDVSSKMIKSGGKISLCIYDTNGRIIYFGERTEELSDNRKIWIKYKNADKYKEIWTNGNNTVMCVMPEQSVIPEASE